MTCWAVCAGQALRHRAWQDEVVLYNDLSGDTHLISCAAWDTLAALQAGPLDLAQLGRRLDPDADPAELQSDLASLLASLAQLGLVHSLPC